MDSTLGLVTHCALPKEGKCLAIGFQLKHAIAFDITKRIIYGLPDQQHWFLLNYFGLVIFSVVVLYDLVRILRLLLA